MTGDKESTPDKIAPKSFIIETSGEPNKPADQTPKDTQDQLAKEGQAQGGKVDSDAVRADIATNSKFLANLLGRNRKTEKTSESKADSTGAQSPADPANPDDKPAKKADAKGQENPDEKPKGSDGQSQDQIRAEKILGKKPASSSAEKPKADDQPKAPIVDSAQLVSAAASAAVAAVTAATKQNTKTPEVVDYPEAYKADAKVFDRMSKLKPEKYGNLKQQLNEFTRAESEYRALWEAKNEGESFDPDAEEHAKFYAKNAPDIDESDIEAAESDLRNEEIDQRVKAEVQQRIAPIEAKQRAEAIVPVIQGGVAAIASAAIQAVLPNVDPAKLTPEMVAKLEDEHPKQIEVINSAVDATTKTFAAYVQITNGVQKINMDDPTHAAVVDVVGRVQDFIRSRPEEEQIRIGSDGVRRKFLPIEEFSKLPASKRDGYWSVGQSEIAAQLQMDAVEIANSKWEKERKALEKYGVKFEQQQPVKRDVRQTSQSAAPAKTENRPEKPAIQVSVAASEMGGSGEGQGSVPVRNTSMFGKLMEGIRPNRVR